MNLKIRPQSLQLCLAPQAARTDARTLRQFLNAGVFARTENISWIFPFCDCGDFEARRDFGWKIFQAVHGEIDSVVSQCFFNLLGEHSFCSDFGERDIRDFVTSRFNDFNFDLMTALAQEISNVIGLPKRQLGAAGTDAQQGHQFSPPESPADLAFFSCKLKSRRTRSTTVVASESRAAVFKALMGVCIILFTIPRVRASMASSCSGEMVPSLPRTRSISA